MDWHEYALQHEFSLALARLQRTRRPLWQRAADRAADLFWRAMIPALNALREHTAAVQALRSLTALFTRQPRAFRYWLMVFLGWLAGLTLGILWAFLAP